MGSGIAEVFAQNGFGTLLNDLSDDTLAKGRASIEFGLYKLQECQRAFKIDLDFAWPFTAKLYCTQQLRGQSK